VSEFGLVAPLGSLVVIAFLYLRRISRGGTATAVGAATAWGLAWLALYAAGTISSVPTAPPAIRGLGNLLGSLFVALVLAGALALRGGSVPGWAVAVGFGIGALRALLAASGRQELSYAVAIPLELPLALGAAAVAWQSARERPRSFPEQLLGPALVLLAFVNAADPLARLVGLPAVPLILSWIATSLAVALLQVTTLVERAREREQRLLAECDLLYQVARLAVAAPRDLSDALERIVGMVASRASLDAFGVWLREGDEGDFLCAARLRRIDELPGDRARISPDDPLVARALASQEPVTIVDLRASEPARRRHRGELEIGETAIAPLRAGGTVLGVALAALSPERRFEDADRRLLAALAQEIALVVAHVRSQRERDHEALAVSERLERSQRMETLGMLAGGVAHDFGNQLTTVLANLRLLRDSPVAMDTSSRRAIGDLEAAAEHCSELVRALLDFARQRPPEPHAVEIEKALRETEGLLRATLPPDVALEVRVAPDTSPVRADPGQLRRVLVNLAVNARDAVGARGRITLSARNLADAPDAPARVTVEVTDTGCGIEADALEHLFDPFFTTKPPGRGTGLGLAIVYGIVEANGASIEVESEPGRGTSFRVLWPAATEGAKAGAAQVASVLAGRETVLVAEDEPAVRRLARLVLEQHGYRVLEACDGEEALQVFESHRSEIDAAVLDCVMPHRGGLDVLRRLRDEVPDLPVVLMSGRPDDADSESRTPGVCLLEKPFRPDQLEASLRQALEARDASA
jgi:signal transduction histidine kinase/ActR/RegA family two-component response regulator